MRRSLLAVLGTVAGTTLLVGAKLGTPPPGDPAAVTLTDAGAVPAAGDPSAAPAPGTTSSSAKPGITTAPPGQPGPSPITPGKTTAPPPPPPPPPGLKNGTFTGSGAAAGHYEVVTVTITVSGGKVTVATGSCGSASGESKTICTRAMSRLQPATIAAQNANVATVSGATYTSRAYKTSLQAALDRAKA
jgi:uncharacterized protein with FMN-binding domain